MTPGPALFTKSNFAPAFWLLTRDRRRALAAVYAFARVVDDAVDETGDAQNRPDAARAILADWRGALATGETRRPEHAALWTELRAAIERFGINKEHLSDLIGGVERDLTPARYATAEEVDAYCDGVASSVGLACLPIFGLTEDRHRAFAVALGRAVQWVNILRDVASDARRGRVYLPLDALRRAGVAEAEVLAGCVSPGLRTVVKEGAARARDYFEKAEAALPPADRRNARPARVMGRLYQGILTKIERGGFNVWNGRVRLSVWDKLRAVVFG